MSDPHETSPAAQSRGGSANSGSNANIGNSANPGSSANSRGSASEGGATSSAPADLSRVEIGKAFAELLPEIEAVPESELIPVTLDIPAAITTALGVAPKVDSLLPELEAVFPSERLERVKKLRLYALALMGAHVAHQTAREPDEPVQEHMERVQAMRSCFADDARPLVTRGIIDPSELEDVRGTPGYKTALNDLAIYHNVFQRHWAAVRSSSGISEAELTEAAELVTRGFSVLGEREQVASRANDSARMRQRAFTLFVGVYAEARRYVQYLRFHHRDAEALAPSLYSGRGNGNHRRAEEELDGGTAPDANSAASASGTPGSGGAAAGSPTNDGVATASTTGSAGAAASATSGASAAPSPVGVIPSVNVTATQSPSQLTNAAVAAGSIAGPASGNPFVA